MDRPPFFIVASARSGTTFLRLTLNAHPEIAVPPESRFITELYTESEVEPADFLARLQQHKRFQVWGLPIEEVANRLPKQDSVAYRQAIEATYEAYAARLGKRYWGDKTPRYVENIPFLAELFPGSRFIHLVRDGRNVALSYAHVDFGPRSIPKAADLWRRRVMSGVRDGRALGSERYIEIRTEDLASDTQGQIQRVCDFLDIGFAASMLDARERAKGEVDKAKHNYSPDVAGRSEMSSWRDQMQRSDVELFEAVSGDALTELGYERAFPSPGKLARYKAQLALKGLPFGALKKTGH